MITRKQDLETKIKNFCISSEADTGYEKYPMHLHSDLVKIQIRLCEGGEQVNQTLRILESALYGLAGANLKQSAKNFVLSNINHSLIANYIIQKNNGFDSNNSNNNIITVITSIIAYYAKVIWHEMEADQ